jgi:hypothetical protein
MSQDTTGAKNALISLFYRLALLEIGYKGSILEFRQPGWPTAEFRW